MQSARCRCASCAACPGAPGGSTNFKYLDLLFHDLRRTAARNYRRLAVGETVIMRIGGWKTRSVFERYNVITQEMLRKQSRNSKKLN